MLPPAFNVPLHKSILLTVCPAVLTVVLLPAATVRLLKATGTVPLIVCTVPLKVIVLPVALKEPLFSRYPPME